MRPTPSYRSHYEFYYQNVYDDGVSVPHKTKRRAREGAAVGHRLGNREYVGYNIVCVDYLGCVSVIVMFVPAKQGRKP
jgi:hypothetical protein